MCVCLVVGGTALVKNDTARLGALVTCPNLRLGATRVASATWGRQAKPFPLKALPRFGRSAHFRQGIVGHHRSTEAFEGIPGRICFQLPASSTRSDDPCPGASSRGLHAWLGNGPGLEQGDDVGLQTQAAAQESREAIPGSSSSSGWAGSPGRSRRGGLEPTMSGCSRAAPLQAGVFPGIKT